MTFALEISFATCKSLRHSYINLTSQGEKYRESHVSRNVALQISRSKSDEILPRKSKIENGEENGRYRASSPALMNHPFVRPLSPSSRVSLPPLIHPAFRPRWFVSRTFAREERSANRAAVVKKGGLTCLRRNRNSFP